MQVSGGNEDSVRNALVASLAESVAGLPEDHALAIAELTAYGIKMWQVYRLANGTPTCKFWPTKKWAEMSGNGLLFELELRRTIGLGDGEPLLIVLSTDNNREAALAYERLQADQPHAPSFTYVGPLDDVLLEVVRQDRLTQSYELVVLRKSSAGKIMLGAHLLFNQEAQSGSRQVFTIRCLPSDAHGVVFAVVATEPNRRFQLVTVQSAVLHPRGYEVTATLVRPGRVRFDGLDAPLLTEHRSWTDIVGSVPDQMHRSPPSHLICLVETSGTSNQVLERISRAEHLIRVVADGINGELRVSLIAYGPHAFSRADQQLPPQVACWAGTSLEALRNLGKLSGHHRETGYHKAAQLECALTIVASRVSDQEGRPVLVTIGARPACPPRVDPVSEILPCPERNDWRQAVKRLRGHSGVAFGAIRDDDAESAPWSQEIWNELGADSFSELGAFDKRGFAARLGLVSPAVQHFPFPFAEA